jgi:O-antigen ligase
MTRVNVVALVLSGGIFWLFYEKGKGQERLGRRIFILITVVLLVGIILTQFTRLSLVIQSLFKMNLDQRLLYRIEGWKRIIPTILSQPVLAYGMGSAGDTLQRLYNFKIHFTSHNLALKILLETGIIGFIFYLSFIGSWLLYIAGLKRDTKDIGIKNLALLSICLLLIILINGLTGSAVEAYPINLYIWFFMGALLRIWRNERREKRDQYSSLSNT